MIEAGWAPRNRQVGQSGKSISPELYLAFGISGASQHISGMINAKYVVAVNTDAEAPIFQYADYGIVGDVNEILPKLLQDPKNEGCHTAPLILAVLILLYRRRIFLFNQPFSGTFSRAFPSLIIFRSLLIVHLRRKGPVDIHNTCKIFLFCKSRLQSKPSQLRLKQ